MSRRKHLMQSLDQAIEAPREGQHIVRAAGSRGSNIIEVEFPDGRSTLCLLPAKFHKKLWVKKGNFLIVEDEVEADGAVTGQIVAVLFADHVKQLRRMPGVWPSEFETSSSGAASQATQQLAALGLAESDSEGEGAGPGPASGSSGPSAASNGAAAGAAGGDGAAAGMQVGAAQQQAGGQQQQQREAAGLPPGQRGGGAAAEDSGSSSEDDLPPIPRFNNRKVIEYEVSDSEDEDD